MNGSISQYDSNYLPEINNLSYKTFIKTEKSINEYKFKNKYISFNFSNFNNYKFNNTYVPYCSVLFKPFIFKNIGLLNENFDLGYCDDTEFNFKITKAGYEISKCFSSIVFHNKKTTFKLLFNDKKIFNIQESNRLQLKISKMLNKNKIKKCVIYTAIIGQNKKLKELKVYDHNNYDYICFTDNPNIITSKNWNVIDISIIKNMLNIDDNIYIATFFKINPHLFFENYEKSIWIDENVNIINNIDSYVNILNTNNYILCYNHPNENSIYNEVDICKKLKKESEEKINNIKNFLLSENYPVHDSLIESNILIRYHNNKNCIFLMKKWWEMIKNYSKLDQLSFNYIFWKYGGKYLTIPSTFILNNFFVTK